MKDLTTCERCDRYGPLISKTCIDCWNGGNFILAPWIVRSWRWAAKNLRAIRKAVKRG